MLSLEHPKAIVLLHAARREEARADRTGWPAGPSHTIVLFEAAEADAAALCLALLISAAEQRPDGLTCVAAANSEDQALCSRIASATVAIVATTRR